MCRTLRVGLMIAVLGTGSARAVPVNIQLEPASTSGVHIGDLLHLDLFARSVPPEQGVLAVQAIVLFDPSLLQIVDTSPGPGWDWFANWVGPDAGTGLLAGDVLFAAGSFSGGRFTDFLIASMTVRALEDFSVTSLDLPMVAVNRGPFSYANKVSNLSNQDVTGELRGAVLYGSGEQAIPEPLTACLFGIGVSFLAARGRRSWRRTASGFGGVPPGVANPGTCAGVSGHGVGKRPV